MSAPSLPTPSWPTQLCQSNIYQVQQGLAEQKASFLDHHSCPVESLFYKESVSSDSTAFFWRPVSLQILYVLRREHQKLLRDPWMQWPFFGTPPRAMVSPNVSQWSQNRTIFRRQVVDPYSRFVRDPCSVMQEGKRKTWDRLRIHASSLVLLRPKNATPIPQERPSGSWG